MPDGSPTGKPRFAAAWMSRIRFSWVQLHSALAGGGSGVLMSAAASAPADRTNSSCRGCGHVHRNELGHVGRTPS
jgi:hypothetical protein